MRRVRKKHLLRAYLLTYLLAYYAFQKGHFQTTKLTPFFWEGGLALPRKFFSFYFRLPAPPGPENETKPIVTEPRSESPGYAFAWIPVLERGHERGRTGLIRSTECKNSFIADIDQPITYQSCDEISNGLAASWLWTAWTVIKVYRRPRLDRRLPTRFHSSMCPVSNHCVWPNKTNSARLVGRRTRQRTDLGRLLDRQSAFHQFRSMEADFTRQDSRFDGQKIAAAASGCSG